MKKQGMVMTCVAFLATLATVAFGDTCILEDCSEDACYSTPSSGINLMTSTITTATASRPLDARYSSSTGSNWIGIDPGLTWGLLILAR